MGDVDELRERFRRSKPLRILCWVVVVSGLFGVVLSIVVREWLTLVTGALSLLVGLGILVFMRGPSS